MKHHGAPLFSSMWVRAKGQTLSAAHTDFDLSADDLKPVHSVIGQLWDLSVSLPNSAHAFSWASDLRKARGFACFVIFGNLESFRFRCSANMFLFSFPGRTMAWSGPSGSCNARPRCAAMHRGSRSAKCPFPPRSAAVGAAGEESSFGTFRALPRASEKVSSMREVVAASEFLTPAATVRESRAEVAGAEDGPFDGHTVFCNLLPAWPGCEAWSYSPVCRRRGPGEGGVVSECSRASTRCRGCQQGRVGRDRGHPSWSKASGEEGNLPHFPTA